MPIPGEVPTRNAVRQYASFHKASYTFEQVIADLVDNAIDADASFVEILVQGQSLPSGPKEHNYLDGPDNLYCIVLDDGFGIPDGKMNAVLSRGFDRVYDETELGSFGVGLKDSSLSQAYELTVFSKVRDNDDVSIRRLSSCFVKRFEEERILREGDLDPWMTGSAAYQKARARVAAMEEGTAILLEGMHKLELKIGEGDRAPYLNAIHTRVKNYLGLVFQRYIEGVEVPRSDGTSKTKKLDLFYGGQKEWHRLPAIDPFYREPSFRNGSRSGTLSLSKAFDTADGRGKAVGQMQVTAWLIPHRLDRSYPEVKQRENELTKTKEGRQGGDGTVGGVGVVDLQGAYIYRNMRLVQFAPDRDPWLGIMTKDSHHNQMRLEVHLPPGLSVGTGDLSDFSINTSKSDVRIRASILERLKSWGASPGERFHVNDPRVVTLRERAIRRNGRENWPKCSTCGSELHKKASCPDRPRCPICGRTGHTRVADCPRRPPCGECGSMDHLTEKHPHPPPSVPPDGGGASPVDGGPGGGTTPVEGPGGATPTAVRVLRTTDGPLVSMAREAGDVVILVNVSSPLYADLRVGIDALEDQ